MSRPSIPVSNETPDEPPPGGAQQASRKERATPRWRRRGSRRAAIVVGLAIVGALVYFAVAKLNLHSVAHTLSNANVGWMLVSLALMGSSLVLRGLSWHETLRAAIPHVHISRPPVVRATIIGVMVSALLPGRAGEPSRTLTISRRLGSARRFFTVVLGTVFSQTLINILALVILAAVTFSRVSILRGREGAIIGAVLVPIVVALLVVGGPRLLRRLARSRGGRLRLVADWATLQVTLARRGLVVFMRPRHGTLAIAAQLAAWALQWLACYAVLLALHFVPRADLATAAAILLAVNVSAILPATPSNVGVFQAACLVVLAAFGFAAGPSLAYGILLQAVEVVTAISMGLVAVAGEGMTWREFSRMGDVGIEEERV